METRKQPGPIAKKYPFSKLKIGDRLEVRADKRNSAAACASRYGRKNGKYFSVHWDEDNEYMLVIERIS